ncbi:hypothetical protein PMAYCL1PPCAC_33073, partial [Pristionchus mayeri]
GQFETSLSAYASLTMYSLIVRVETLVPALLKRLRHSIDGEWEFGVTGRITAADLQAVIAPDMILTKTRRNEDRISIKASNRQVVINISQGQHGLSFCARWRCDADNFET